MLKIVQSGTVVEQRWTLCGRLAGPWVTELQSTWARTRDEPDRRKQVIDLRDVTFIDESGAGLLRQMRAEGAEFVASGVDTIDVLNNLGSAGKRPLRKFLPHLVSRCEEQEEADLKEDK